MKVLTEIELRSNLRKMDSVSTYTVPPGTILTPAARSFLSDRKIDIVFSDEKPTSPKESPGSAGKKIDSEEESPDKPRYYLVDTGIYTDKKPEAYTHINANNLVPKYHPRIKLRGKIDDLEAHIIMAQTVAQREKMEVLVEELDEILKITKSILRAEVMSEPLEDFSLFGKAEQEIREMSHNPKKHIGVNHFFPSCDMGEMMACLNVVRTKVRETEIVAVETFFDPSQGLEREDIIKALNRLSSAVYVMMCRLLAGRYSRQGMSYGR